MLAMLHRQGLRILGVRQAGLQMALTTFVMLGLWVEQVQLLYYSVRKVITHGSKA